MKIRCNMLSLNFKFWKNGSTICNISTSVVEDMVHFIGKCPKFKKIREKYFHKPYVEEEEILLILKGSNWKMLHG